MKFRCDNCPLRFEHELDHDGESCLSCEDGTIELDIDAMTDEEVHEELLRRGITEARLEAANDRVKTALRKARESSSTTRAHREWEEGVL